MQKFVLVLAICLLGLTLAYSQSAQQSPSAQQPSAQQSSPSAQPPQSSTSPSPSQSQSPSAQPTPKSGDTTVSGSSSNQQQTPEQSATNQGRAQRAQNQGGLPWVWIIVGIVAVVILIALATRGGDRVEHIDRVERHDDDIRRVG